MHGDAMWARHPRWKEMSAGRKALTAARWAAIAAAVLAAASVVVMLLWNRVMSGILGLPALGFWDAVCLLILAKILLSGRGSSFIARMRMRRVMREHMARHAESDEGKRD